MNYRMILVCILLAGGLLMPACNQNASSSTPALKVTVKDIWLSNPEDLDSDGYNSYLRMNMDFDVNRSSLDVFVEVYARLHDPADTSLYYQYFPPPDMDTPVFTISGDTPDDAVYLSIGDPNIELPQAEWDFALLLYSAADPEQPILGLDYSDVAAFSAVAMEEVVTDGGIIIYDAWWYDEDDVDGDGYFSKAKLGVDVDVPSGSTADVFLDLFIKTSGSSNYTYYGSTGFFTVNGDSEDDAVGINFDDTFAHDDYDFRVASMVYNGEVIEDMVDRSTAGIIGESLGGMPLELASEDVAQPLTVTFTNQVFTPISITVGSQRTRTISVSGSEQYYFILNPGTITFSASTYGKTDTGTRIGEQVLWQYTVDVSGKTSASYNLTLSADMFYMRMQNTGTKNLAPIYVNYGLADQTMDNILIQPDNITYDIGYYKAHANTEVRAYWVGETGYYSYWQQGVHFTLPFTQNQSVTLLNTSKTGTSVSSAIVNTGYDRTLPAAWIPAETAAR